jgi:hypothetical protein
MEGYQDCGGDYGEIDGESEPGEKCALVGKVVASVGCGVFEEEGA